MLRLLTRTPIWLSVALGLVLLAPTLGLGFYVDDYGHQLTLDHGGEGTPMRPWALYDFGTLADWRADRLGGAAFPWWTGADWKVRFLRPLSSLYLWACHAVFGGWALGYHLVGLALFTLLLLQAGRLYAELGLAPGAVRAATLCLALSHTLVLPAGWIANVNSLLVALLGVLALRWGARWSADTRAPWRATLALGAALSALLCKESGVVVALLLALLWSLRASAAEPAARRRLRRAAGAALGLLLLYALAYALGGYGTRSVYYATPWGDPGRWLANLGLLFSGGLVALVGPYPLDLALMVPSSAPAVALVGVLLALPLCLALARNLRGMSGWIALVAWVLLFLGVQAGAAPSGRLLAEAMVGAAGLLGAFFELRGRRTPPAPRPARWATGLLALSATLGSGAFALLQTTSLTQGARYLRETVRAADLGPSEPAAREVFVLQSESMLAGFALSTMLPYLRTYPDLTLWLLQIGTRPLRWTRTGEREFELESLGEPFLGATMETPYMTSTAAIEPGRRWSTRAFEVEALDVRDGRPTRLAFRLQVSLDDAQVGFVRPVAGILNPIAPPRLGESLELPVPERVGPYMP